MASSRVFVKGLPPTFTEPDFRKHFSQNGRHVTDVKIFPSRRIGYIGYKTPEDAQKAVKYFNKTFIRMSRIGVELARPIEEPKSLKALGAENKDNDGSSAADDGNKLKRKRDDLVKKGDEEADPKLKEFLEVYKPKSKKAAWENEAEQSETAAVAQDQEQPAAVVDGESDDDYEQVPKKAKRLKDQSKAEDSAVSEQTRHTAQEPEVVDAEDSGEQPKSTPDQPALSDADWARSRTSRLLGLLDDEEDANVATTKPLAESEDDSDVDMDAETSPNEKAVSAATAAASIPTPPGDTTRDAAESKDDVVTTAEDSEGVRSSMRLFVRNLPFDLQPEELEAEFAQYGNLEEVHLARDKKTGTGKGFAFVQYTDPDSAEQALTDRDGKPFQGRLLHIIAAKPRRQQLDEFEISKLPLKKQQEIKRRREASSKTFNWNALYMNADAVVSSVASRLGLSKSEVLDPTSSDAAVKQAHAETHIIQETKSYFRQQGVDLDSFKRSQRGDTAILVKNIPSDCSKDELKRLFEEHGDIKKFLMPPSGTIAIIEYANSAQCQAAFGALAYRKLRSSMLFLEKAPKDLFSGAPIASEVTPDGVSKVSGADLKDSEQTVPDTLGSATLYVRNLNFTTTTQLLTDTFKPLSGFLSARVKTKTDPKKPGQVLSMGFGFLEFRSSQEAQATLQAMDGYTLEGHKLQIRASHKGADAAEERRKADAEKKAVGRKTKVIIKNLPFEATKKDIRALFGAYGQLRSVRVPKKMDRGARGFAFADFMTIKEAQGAMDALRDTHLLGRRLVLDFAAEGPEDAEAELEKMQQKVGAQVNKVALQKLTSGGRKKFTTQQDEDDG